MILFKIYKETSSELRDAKGPLSSVTSVFLFTFELSEMKTMEQSSCKVSWVLLFLSVMYLIYSLI